MSTSKNNWQSSRLNQPATPDDPLELHIPEADGCITEGWREASTAKPCPICGHAGWCSLSLDGEVVHCRRRTETDVMPGWRLDRRTQDRSGQEYGRWRLDHERQRGRMITRRTVEAASPSVRHQVYQALLNGLQLIPAAIAALEKRGLTQDDIQRNGYRYLGGNAERMAAVQALIEIGQENRLLGVPGFHRDSNGWTFIGPPGIAIPVRDVEGRIVAIKIRADKPVKSRKYFYASSTKYKGPGPGAPVHVPFHTDVRPGATVRVTEGELKSDVATARTGILTLGLPGIGQYQKAASILEALGVKRVLIAPDADWRTNATVANAVKAMIDCFSGFCEVAVEIWHPDWGKGIDDVLAAGKKPKVLTGKKLKRLLRKLGRIVGNAARLPVIEIGTDQMRVNDQAVAALASDPSVFRRSGLLVHIIRDEHRAKLIKRTQGSPRITPLRQAVLCERMAASAQWVKRNHKGELVRVHPPKWSVSAVLDRGDWNSVRPLEGVVLGPVLRADGTVLCASGYDPGTGLYCLPGIVLPEIPNEPSREDIKQALAILVEAIQDFDFEGPAHAATWIAFLLTVLARPAFPGPAPLFLFDASAPGSGKGLLVDLVATITSGRMIAKMANPANDEEARKSITSLALAGDPLILIDNVEGSLGTSSLNLAMTTTGWKDRLLGTNTVVDLPLMAIWAATGNNVEVVGDMTRRVIRARLCVREEHPEKRTNFLHPRLLEWAAENRGNLLSAAFTLLRGYWAAGKPPQRLDAWGSYEAWSDLVRGTVVWAGLPDPAETREAIAKNRDVQALETLMTGLSAFDGHLSGLTSSEILTLAAEPPGDKKEAGEMIREAVMQLVPTKTGALPHPQPLGMRLHHLSGRVIAGRYLDKTLRNGIASWKIVDVKQGTKGTKWTNSFPSQKRNKGEEEENVDGRGENSPLSPLSPLPAALSNDTEVF